MTGLTLRGWPNKNAEVRRDLGEQPILPLAGLRFIAAAMIVFYHRCPRRIVFLDDHILDKHLLKRLMGASCHIS